MRSRERPRSGASGQRARNSKARLGTPPRRIRRLGKLQRDSRSSGRPSAKSCTWRGRRSSCARARRLWNKTEDLLKSGICTRATKYHQNSNALASKTSYRLPHVELISWKCSGSESNPIEVDIVSVTKSDHIGA
jgi:hypothetical protein